MATTYKTPGVYVEEIPKFPPSVAPVDTAIPAFIGYTEKAIDKVADDLILKPKRIESLVEFEQFFGLPQPESEASPCRSSTITEPGGQRGVTAALDETDRSKHILYYALQLFYANGGGSAFIVSVGQVQGDRHAALVVGELQKALEPLTKVDEPTLIVVPEAHALKLIADFGTLPERRSWRSARSWGTASRSWTCTVTTSHCHDPNSNLRDAVTNFRNRASAPTTSTTAPPTRRTSRPSSTSSSTRS